MSGGLITVSATIDQEKVSRWVNQISATWNKAKESFFETGRELIAAQDDCNHGEWMKLIGTKQAEGKLPFGYGTANMLINIAACERFQSSKTFELLPNSWASCYDLIKLSDEDFDAAIDDGVVRSDAKYTDISHFVRARQREATHKTIAEKAALARLAGDDTFTLIYADPPWLFELYSDKANKSAVDHYPVMQDNKINTLKVGDIWIGDRAAKDSILFLWSTPSMLLRSLDVMVAWGFEYRSHLAWVKDKAGTGFYSRQRHEPLLIGIKGKPPSPLWVPESAIEAPRGRHSEKPPLIRETIEKMYPYWGEDMRLELFARGPVPGWSVFGHEAE